jgi:hypothetical protein
MRQKATLASLHLLMGLLALQTAHAQDTSAPNAPAPTSPGAPSPVNPSNAAPPPAPAAPPAGAPGSNMGEEPSPFVFGISQSLTGNSNLFRAPEGSPLLKRDRIWSSGLHVGVDKSIGRQHFNLDLRGNYNRYNKNTHLNNTDYIGSARWDWETVERISGELSAQQRQSLYRDTIDGVTSTERNQVRTTSLAFQARVGLVTRWSFEAGAAASENNYTGTAVENRDVRQNSANAGLRYRPSPDLSTRVGVRRSEGRYPRFTGEADHFTRDDVDLTATIQASGASRLDTRVSATRERHSVQSQRDTRGVTGGLGWAWRPTGKVTLDLDLSHDRSVGQTGFDSSLIGADASEAQQIQTASLAATWAATAKISIVPRVSYMRRELDNGFVSGGGGTTLTGEDRTTIGGIALHYQPARSLTLSCEVTREHRTVSGSPGLSSPYTATIAGCSGEFALR